MLNSEKAIFAMNDVDDNHLESARELLGYRTEYAVRRPIKKRIITFALAAALILGLGAAAYAIYRAAMHTRIPAEGTTDYHVLYQADPEATPQLLHVDFDKTKLALSFDVPEGGYFPVMKVSGLPGESENWQKTSFYDMLVTAQVFGLPWEMKQVDQENMEIDTAQELPAVQIPDREPQELLNSAGMDAETAKNWFTGYIYRNRDRDIAGDNMDIIRVDLFGGYKLHGQEVILGAFSPEGVEANPVKEGTLGEFQMVEVQMLQASGAIDNHLFLFHPEKYYLLHICGNGTYYDFSVLEQIGQNIDVTETSLYVDSYENKVNFILADLAAG